MRTRWPQTIQFAFLLLIGSSSCYELPVPAALGEPCSTKDDCATDFCYWETCLSPSADDDGDLLNNFAEQLHGSNPFVEDTDQDSLSDYTEVYTPEGTFQDRDGDGLGDAVEHNFLDSDSDCLPDWADPSYQKTAASFTELLSYHCLSEGECTENENNIEVTCSDGVIACDYSKVAGYGGPVESLCDGRDENCDGSVDEAFSLNGETPGFPCPALGGCPPGIVECRSDQLGAICSTQSGGSEDSSTPEQCDGIDNNCDGEIDEGFSLNGMAIGTPCTAFGSCGTGIGAITCIQQMNAPRCLANTGAISPIGMEMCDGIDNDCDGVIDNGIHFTNPIGEQIALGEPCGEGVCANGIVVCSASFMPHCSTESLAFDEVCDGIDNNCDGAIDDGLTYLGKTLGSPCEGLGECGVGTVECGPLQDVALCSTGAMGSKSEATDEVCDGMDNDCNGLTDEGIPGPDTANPSSCQSKGICGVGAWTCGESGEWVCSTSPGEVNSPSQPETCNGLDDDCDGHTDEFLALTLSATWEWLGSLSTQAPVSSLFKATGSPEQFFIAAPHLQLPDGSLPIVAWDRSTEEESYLPSLPLNAGGVGALHWDSTHGRLLVFSTPYETSASRIFIYEKDAESWAEWIATEIPTSAPLCRVLRKSGVLQISLSGMHQLQWGESTWADFPVPEGLATEELATCYGSPFSDDIVLLSLDADGTKTSTLCTPTDSEQLVECDATKEVPGGFFGWWDGSAAEAIFPSLSSDQSALTWTRATASTVPQLPTEKVFASFWIAETAEGVVLGEVEGEARFYSLSRSCP